MNNLDTPVCELLGIDYPIVLAGMGGASTPELAAAVSNAGGLGVLGAATCQPETLRSWIRRTRELTNRPFGVDTLLPASVRQQSAAETAPGDIPLKSHQRLRGCLHDHPRAGAAGRVRRQR